MEFYGLNGGGLLRDLCWLNVGHLRRTLAYAITLKIVVL